MIVGIYFAVKSGANNNTKGVDGDSASQIFERAENAEIKLLQKYLQFQTISPTSDFGIRAHDTSKSQLLCGLTLAYFIFHRSMC